MDVNVIFKIGAIGILVAALYLMLKNTGREELAFGRPGRTCGGAHDGNTDDWRVV